eukprot:354661-Chlamydomonas_euryale.AAC.3
MQEAICMDGAMRPAHRPSVCARQPLARKGKHQSQQQQQARRRCRCPCRHLGVASGGRHAVPAPPHHQLYVAVYAAVATAALSCACDSCCCGCQS